MRAASSMRRLALVRMRTSAGYDIAPEQDHITRYQVTGADLLMPAAAKAPRTAGRRAF